MEAANGYGNLKQVLAGTQHQQLRVGMEVLLFPVASNAAYPK